MNARAAHLLHIPVYVGTHTTSNVTREIRYSPGRLMGVPVDYTRSMSFSESSPISGAIILKIVFPLRTLHNRGFKTQEKTLNRI